MTFVDTLAINTLKDLFAKTNVEALTEETFHDLCIQAWTLGYNAAKQRHADSSRWD